jgi:hypothetical protein
VLSGIDLLATHQDIFIQQYDTTSTASQHGTSTYTALIILALWLLEIGFNCLTLVSQIGPCVRNG